MAVEWVRHASPSGIVLDHPAGWTVEELGEGIAVRVAAPGDPAGGYTPTVLVTVEPTPADLETYAADQVLALQQILTDLQVIDLADARLVDRPALRALAGHRLGLHTLVSELWWAVDDGRGITCAATAGALDHADLEPIFARLADGIAIDGGAQA
jgi:hypothetical protein